MVLSVSLSLISLSLKKKENYFLLSTEFGYALVLYFLDPGL